MKDEWDLVRAGSSAAERAGATLDRWRFRESQDRDLVPDGRRGWCPENTADDAMLDALIASPEVEPTTVFNALAENGAIERLDRWLAQHQGCATPLSVYIAVHHGQGEAAIHLIEHGATPNDCTLNLVFAQGLLDVYKVCADRFGLRSRLARFKDDKRDSYAGTFLFNLMISRYRKMALAVLEDCPAIAPAMLDVAVDAGQWRMICTLVSPPYGLPVPPGLLKKAVIAGSTATVRTLVERGETLVSKDGEEALESLRRDMEDERNHISHDTVSEIGNLLEFAHA